MVRLCVTLGAAVKRAAGVAATSVASRDSVELFVVAAVIGGVSGVVVVAMLWLRPGTVPPPGDGGQVFLMGSEIAG